MTIPQAIFAAFLSLALWGAFLGWLLLVLCR
jgi:hypothetical protein